MEATIEAFHGGGKEGAEFFTTDRDHASLFGAVHGAALDLPSATVEVESIPAHLADEAGVDVSGWMGGEIEAAFLSWMDEAGVRAAIIHDHPETTGDVIIVRRSRYISWRD